MSESIWIRVGHIKAAHGLKGHVHLYLKAGRADWIEHFSALKLTQKTTTKQFQVESAVPFKHGLIVKLVGVNDRNASEALHGWSAEIEENYLKAEPGERVFLHQLLSWQVQDEQLGLIGEVARFSSNGPQDLLVVQKTDRTWVELPLVDDFIVDLDWEKRVLQMSLPEGLLEI